MKTKKFDNYDRNRVVSEVEKYFQVKLHKAGSRDIYLKDETGKTYWVIGGVGDYHGIPKEMFPEEEKQSIEGVLVVAKKKLNSIDVFAGSLLSLIKSKRMLTVTDIQYQFDVCPQNDILKLKQAPDVRLKKIAVVPYTTEEKVADKTVHDTTQVLKKYFKNMSEEQAIELIQRFNQTRS